MLPTRKLVPHPFVNQLHEMLESKRNELDEKEDQRLIEGMIKFQALSVEDQNEIFQMMSLLNEKVRDKDQSVTGLQCYLLALFYQFSSHPRDFPKAQKLFQQANKLLCPNARYAWLKSALASDESQLPWFHMEILRDKIRLLNEKELQECLVMIQPLEERVKEEYLTISGYQYYVLFNLYARSGDLVKSKDYLLKAAKMNSGSAFRMMGSYYEEGSLGFQKDSELAYEFYQKAVDHGVLNAATNFGSALKNSITDAKQEDADLTAHDVAKVISLFELAAKEGDPHAWYNLGNTYKNGLENIPIMPEEALTCYRKSAFYYRELFFCGLLSAEKDLKELANQLKDDVETLYYVNIAFPGYTDTATLYNLNSDILTQLIIADMNSPYEEVRDRASNLIKKLSELRVSHSSIFNKLQSYPSLLRAVSELTIKYFQENNFKKVGAYFAYIINQDAKFTYRFPQSLLPDECFQLGYHLDLMLGNVKAKSDFEKGFPLFAWTNLDMGKRINHLPQLFLIRAAWLGSKEARTYLLSKVIDELNMQMYPQGVPADFKGSPFRLPSSYLDMNGIDELFGSVHEQVILMRQHAADFNDPKYLEKLQDIAKINNYLPILINQNGNIFLFEYNRCLKKLNRQQFLNIGFPVNKTEFKKLKAEKDFFIPTMEDIRVGFLHLHEKLTKQNQDISDEKEQKSETHKTKLELRNDFLADRTKGISELFLTRYRTPYNLETLYYFNTVFPNLAHLNELHKKFQENDSEVSKLFLTDIHSESKEVRARAFFLMEAVLEACIKYYEKEWSLPVSHESYLACVMAELIIKYFQEGHFEKAGRYYFFLIRTSGFQWVNLPKSLLSHEYLQIGTILAKIEKDNKVKERFMTLPYYFPSWHPLRTKFFLTNEFLQQAKKPSPQEDILSAVTQVITKLRTNNNTLHLFPPIDYVKKEGIGEVFRPVPVILMQLPVTLMQITSIAEALLHDLSHQHLGAPILIKNYDNFYLYGFSQADQNWRFTVINPKLFSKLTFPKKENELIYLKTEDCSSEQLDCLTKTKMLPDHPQQFLHFTGLLELDILSQIIVQLTPLDKKKTNPFLTPEKYVKINGIHDIFKPSPIVLLEVKDLTECTTQKLKQISKDHFSSPILIKYNDNFFVFGFSQGTWKLSQLAKPKLFAALNFNTNSVEQFVLNDEQLNAIRELHTIPDLYNRFLHFAEYQEQLLRNKNVPEKKQSVLTTFSFVQPSKTEPEPDSSEDQWVKWCKKLDEVLQALPIPEDKNIKSELQRIKDLFTPGLEETDSYDDVYKALQKSPIQQWIDRIENSENRSKVNNTFHLLQNELLGAIRKLKY